MASNTYLLREPPKADPVMLDNIRKLNYFIQEVIKNNNKLNLNYDSASQVKISGTDTTADYLYNKIAAGTGITKTKSGSGKEILTISSSAVNAHTDLTDMPDTAGTNTDHDERYRVKQQAAQPVTNADWWYDSDAPDDFSIYENIITNLGEVVTHDGKVLHL
jgi:hypothetical protein